MTDLGLSDWVWGGIFVGLVIIAIGVLCWTEGVMARAETIARYGVDPVGKKDNNERESSNERTQ
jgi:hypothetical protein